MTIWNLWDVACALGITAIIGLVLWFAWQSYGPPAKTGREEAAGAKPDNE